MYSIPFPFHFHFASCYVHNGSVQNLQERLQNACGMLEECLRNEGVAFLHPFWTILHPRLRKDGGMVEERLRKGFGTSGMGREQVGNRWTMGME